MVDASLLIKATKLVEIYPEEILLKDEKSQETLSINRNDCSIHKKSSTAHSSGSSLLNLYIKCIYGIIDLPASKYLLLVTEANYVGEILSKKIFHVEKIVYIPISPKVELTSLKNIRFPTQDKTYLEMLDTFFAKKFLYFSFEYDLTNSLQTNLEKGFDRSHWKNQYFFNETLMQDFIKGNHSEWICPIISGIVDVSHIQVEGNDADLLIVSRRDKSRSGMRFVSRGCDLDGNCSNTAETEQIFIVYKKNSFDVKIFSYSQLRGSIPYIWQQKPTLKWEPKGETPMEGHNVDVAKKHVEKIVKEYGSQVFINLIDKKGTQKKMGDEFNRVMTQLNYPSNVCRLIWFDFHHECRKMKWENLSKLLDQVKQDINALSFFEANMKKGNLSSFQVIQKQKGTFRTNCMDCLDRTNVVQSVIARRLLWTALNRAEIIQLPYELGAFEKMPEELEKAFRETWNKNANVLSILYTGTNALKTDFTRTGKRTKKGALQDGQNSIMRYIKNNFYDGYNQNCIDLVLGKYKPKETEYKKKPFNNVFYVGAMVFVVPVFMFFLLNTLEQELFANHAQKPSTKIKSTIFYWTVFGLSITMLFKAIASNHHKLIEKPILNH